MPRATSGVYRWAVILGYPAFSAIGDQPTEPTKRPWRFEALGIVPIPFKTSGLYVTPLIGNWNWMKSLSLKVFTLSNQIVCRRWELWERFSSLASVRFVFTLHKIRVQWNINRLSIRHVRSYESSLWLLLAHIKTHTKLIVIVLFSGTWTIFHASTQVKKKLLIIENSNKCLFLR